MKDTLRKNREPIFHKIIKGGGGGESGGGGPNQPTHGFSSNFACLMLGPNNCKNVFIYFNKDF